MIFNLKKIWSANGSSLNFFSVQANKASFTYKQVCQYSRRKRNIVVQ